MGSGLRVKGALFPLLYSGFIGVGMLLCLAVAFWLHFSKVTRNHCRVWEFWPSVSAVIGDYGPEKNIWRCAIALGAGPRFVAAILNYKVLLESVPDYQKLLKIALWIDVLRIAWAGLWTYISSSEYLLFHVFSFVWCGIHTYLFSKALHKESDGKFLLKSYRVKQICLYTQVLMFLTMLYFFYIHQMHCTAGAYSMYAVCEWILSACNIIFDASCAWDFQDLYFNLEEEKKKK